MGKDHSSERAYVIYRGVGRGDRTVEVHLVIRAAVASVGDAWARLTALDPSVDPQSIEMEIRRQRRMPARIGHKEATTPIDLARWVAARAAMAHHARP
jgi:hypothetical protein